MKKKNYVISYPNKIKHSKFFCSFKYGVNNVMNIDSRFLQISIALEIPFDFYNIKALMV